MEERINIGSGFNGQEKVNEISGVGNHNTAEFWEYDTRLGRRWNLDPMGYDFQSHYSAFNNNPVFFADPLGLYGTKEEAEKQRQKAAEAGYNPAEINGSGDLYYFNAIDPNDGKYYTYKDFDFFSISSSLGRGSYDGSYLKSSGNYDLNEFENQEKFEDDINYIINGKNGNWFTRWYETFSRDWQSSSTSDKVEFARDVISVIPLTKFGTVRNLWKSKKSITVGTDAAKGSTQLWTSTSKMSSVKNAFGYWKKHGAEFPQFINAKQYVEGAKNFMHNSPAGTLIKTRANGDILKYHSGTNTFGVMDASGVPRTMFKPTDGMKYWLGK